jgi:hypothetical protein
VIRVDSNLSDAARLINEALKAPPGTTELTTESGRAVRVEREPAPGIRLRLTWPRTDEETAGWLELLVEAVDQRPESYPTGVPFVPQEWTAIRGHGLKLARE